MYKFMLCAFRYVIQYAIKSHLLPLQHFGIKEKPSPRVQPFVSEFICGHRLENRNDEIRKSTWRASSALVPLIHKQLKQKWHFAKRAGCSECVFLCVYSLFYGILHLQVTAARHSASRQTTAALIPSAKSGASDTFEADSLPLVFFLFFFNNSINILKIKISTFLFCEIITSGNVFFEVISTQHRKETIP